jgi:hypothetical protein
MHKQRIHVGWKPWLCFVKDDKSIAAQFNDISDVIKSNPVNKETYSWERSQVEVEYYIKNMTVESDPFRPVYGFRHHRNSSVTTR